MFESHKRHKVMLDQELVRGIRNSEYFYRTKHELPWVPEDIRKKYPLEPRVSMNR